MPPELRRTASYNTETDVESEDGLYLPIDPSATPPAMTAYADHSLYHTSPETLIHHHSSTPIQHPRPQSLQILQSPLHALDYAPEPRSHLSTPTDPGPADADFLAFDYPQGDMFGHAQLDDSERTPVIAENQDGGRLISSAADLPRPPTTDADATIRQRPPKRAQPLLSPFAPRFAAQPTPQHYTYSDVPVEYAPPEQYAQPVYADPSNPNAYYAYPIPQQPTSAGPSPQQSPYGAFHPSQVPQYMHPGMYQPSPTQPHIVYTEPPSSQHQMPQYVQAPLPPQHYTFANHPPRSRQGSQESSAPSRASSVASSITRSHSTASSDVRMTARPKVKLTFEDKRRIVEIARGNTSLRQEDIARQYGVDRSTISKILLSSHRWTAPPEHLEPSAPKPPKTVGGRFPAIEARMHEWMDMQFAAGNDVRDAAARDQAKNFAKEIGFPMERFKASAKWLDKFKDRRKAAGKPVMSIAATNMIDQSAGIAINATGPYAAQYIGQYYSADFLPGQMYASAISPAASSALLSRSHSTATLSSSSSSGNERAATLLNTPNRLVGANKSDSDLLNHYASAAEMGPHIVPSTNSPNRQRSQSSPQVLNLGGSLVDPGTMSPSSGKMRTQRPVTSALTRQNSYHGASPSPRRSTALTRATSSSSNLLLTASQRRANRPPSLAASAFGLTPMSQDGSWSPVPSPTTSGSSSGTHSRRRSEVGALVPFSSLSVMSISPDVSTPGSATMQPGIVPPLTPLSPKGYMSGYVQQQGSVEDFQYAPQQMVYTQPSYNPGYHFAQHSVDGTLATTENWQ